MNDSKNNDMHQSDEQTVKRREMSRRQFLNYTLGGTGAFLAFVPLIANLRFAVDPILQPKKAADWVKVVEESKITTEPKAFEFQVHQIDGWYESDPKFQAWISKGEDGKIFALSPICKHLGCTIDWNTNEDLPNQYFCPCHGAHYTKDGLNLAVAPLPLDEYSVKILNGYVYVGELKPNTRVE